MRHGNIALEQAVLFNFITDLEEERVSTHVKTASASFWNSKKEPKDYTDLGGLGVLPAPGTQYTLQPHSSPISRQGLGSCWSLFHPGFHSKKEPLHLNW